jgi:YVTN family beta-propeller protein
MFACRPAARFLSRLVVATLLGCLPAAAALAQQSYVLNGYIGNFGDNTVTVIDTATNTVTGTFGAENAARGIAVTPDGSTAYIVNGSSNSVSVYDAASNTVVATIPVGSNPTGAALAPNGALLYVANTNDNSISIVNTGTDTVVATITGLPGAEAIAITPDGSKAYVASGTPGAFALDLSSKTIVASFSFFGDSILPVISPDGSTAYFATVDNVEVVDVASDSQVASIPSFGQIASIAVAPDGARIWAVNQGANQVLVIDAATNQIAATIQVGNGPNSIAFSADGTKAFVIVAGDDNVTVIDTATGQIVDQITVPDNSQSIGGFIAPAPPPSEVVAALLPGGRSVEVGATATVFATILNASNDILDDCGISLPGESSIDFDYQTTDPATNGLIGSPDTPVTIAANGFQTYLLSFQSSSPQSVQALPLVFGCNGTPPAAVVTGVNTVDLLFSPVPVADIIALSATASGNGVVTVPFSQGGAAAFAVASVNAGADGALTVVTDTGDAALPITVTICETNPSNGQCLAPPTDTVPVAIAGGDTPTFSFFVTASGDVPFAPGTSRIFVRFLDAANTSHGSTSVAVTTD